MSSPRSIKARPSISTTLLYCARGRAETLIKMHKSQLASDWTSCRSANANRMRLILHSAAFWLMWRIQQEIPKATAPNFTTLATAEFSTLRLRLLKDAARIIESATRIRVAFASAGPDAALFRSIALALRPALAWPTRPRRRKPQPSPSILQGSRAPAMQQAQRTRSP